MKLQLTDAEVADLVLEGPADDRAGGFQGLLHRLREGLAADTNEINISDEDVERIQRAILEKGGGWQYKLARVFERTLGGSGHNE